MNQPAQNTAWLETANGERVPVRGTCSLGRSRSNNLVLGVEKISRRHALVHAQGVNEFWLVDFGSANGTFLNGRRVTHPIPLRDQDLIEIGHVRLAFRRSATADWPDEDLATSRATAREIQTLPCWLLVADIEASTKLGQSLPPDQLPVVIGRWFSLCKQCIDENGGTINKFLGDGLFAYWIEQDDSVAQIACALEQLQQAQVQAEPRFRVVVHYGLVSLGGTASLGEESLLGQEVNFAFRMEKLASSLSIPCLVSEAVSHRLKSVKPASEVGRYPLAGFEGDFRFFTF